MLVCTVCLDADRSQSSNCNTRAFVVLCPKGCGASNVQMPVYLCELLSLLRLEFFVPAPMYTVMIRWVVGPSVRI